MKFKNVNAEIFIPDNKPVEEALPRTTHMGIAAHQDDLEIMAYDGILNCFGSEKHWFLGVTVTNGAGSPRDGLYAHYTDEEMQKIRRVEQKKAAVVGEYGAMVFLDYTSSAAKDPKNQNVLADLKTLFTFAKPSVVYTHNLADKHDTHVAVALKTIHALRELPKEIKPKQVYGCEVWRDFDWMIDSDKVALDVSAHENLAASLLGVYDSQICGGKRYDIATIGRRRANATYYASHGVDTSTYLIYAMDLTPLIKDPKLNIKTYIQEYIDRFSREVAEKIEKLGY
jgi:LmbE family N-acetylglucosaminyl deacetylase